MRNVLGITLAVAVVLLVNGNAFANTIAIREGGGTLTWDSVAYTMTDTNVDDSYIYSGGNPAGDGNYGTDTTLQTYVLTNGAVLQRVMLYGVKNLSTLLPATSGGQDLVIDNATLVVASKNSGTAQSLPLSVALVTEDWLGSTAGSNETAVTWNTTDGSTPWSPGPTSFDYTADVSGSVTADTTLTTGWGKQNGLDIKNIVEAWYDTGNTGLAMWLDPADASGFTNTTWSIVSSEDEAGNWNGQNSLAKRPALLIDYHYEGGAIPEPGTMLLVGSGALGLLGYLRRRKMN